MSTRFPARPSRGRIARVAPVLDPATRTASMEIEVPNPTFRLKPGCTPASLTTVTKRGRARGSRNAMVDYEGKRGVFLSEGDKAPFRAVRGGHPGR